MNKRLAKREFLLTIGTAPMVTKQDPINPLTGVFWCKFKAKQHKKALQQNNITYKC